MATVGLAAGSAQSADGPPAKAPVITNPDWLRKPSGDDLGRFYPIAAGGRGGRAVITCVVTVRGTLDRCVVESETPPGKGLGAAALALVPMFMMKPMTLNGEPVGGATVTVPVNFGASDGVMPIFQARTLAHSLPWETSPTAAELAAAFPREALGRTTYGHVVLQCRVSGKRKLDDCETVTETPVALGFSGAARTLAKEFTVAADSPVLKEVRDLYVELPFDFRDPTKLGAAPEIYDAEWLQGPDPDMAGAIYPPDAAKAGVKTGLGVVECDVTHAGTLSGCTVAAENPAGYGFGETALAVAKIMRMNPWTKQGFPVDSARVRVPIRLNLDATTQAPPSTAARP